MIYFYNTINYTKSITSRYDELIFTVILGILICPDTLIFFKLLLLLHVYIYVIFHITFIIYAFWTNTMCVYLNYLTKKSDSVKFNSEYFQKNEF